MKVAGDHEQPPIGGAPIEKKEEEGGKIEEEKKGGRGVFVNDRQASVDLGKIEEAYAEINSSSPVPFSDRRRRWLVSACTDRRLR